MNDRSHRTERAAHRLIKSQARKYVYTAKAQEIDGSAYESMLMLEAAIEEDATQAWVEMLASWPQGFAQLALPSLIKQAAQQARKECYNLVELGGMAARALDTFFTLEFEPESLLFQWSGKERPS